MPANGQQPSTRSSTALRRNRRAQPAETYEIGYLVSRVYDPAWQDKQSWVWTLRPVVSDPEFRALDCGP